MVMSIGNTVCHLLYNNTSRESSSLPSQVAFDGHTYAVSYYDSAYSIHQNEQHPCGHLIDGGANGGLSGSDVAVLAETFLTANVTLLLALSRISMVP
jgi:hypothetical protein